MQQEEIYISVDKEATAEITEKKSRFIANVRHVESESEAMEFVDKIKKQHYNARHNVYAYILNSGIKKYTDDGEPSKTAGLPILEMLEKQGITDVICVVTRYFGGTLLGTGGLVRAYTEAAKEGVAQSGIVKMNLCRLMEIRVPYAHLGSAEYLLKSFGANCEDKNYAEHITLTVTVEETKADTLIENIKNDFAGAVEARSKGKVYRKI